MAVTIYNEISLDKLDEFKQKIVEGSGSNIPTEELKDELIKTQEICKDLGMQIAKTKIEITQKDNLIKGLGEQQAKTKIELTMLKNNLNK